MEFQTLTLNDIPAVRPYFSFARSGTCDFTVGGMFMWRRFYAMERLFDSGVFYSRLRGENGELYYNLPLGENIPKAIEQCILRWKKQGHPLRFCTIPEDCLPFFFALCPEARVTEQRDFFDYRYLSSDLAELKGSRYHAQRNQISRFLRSYSDWSFLKIGEVSTEELISFFRRFASDEENGTAGEENQMVFEVLQHREQYGMLGGALTVDGRIVGFSLGEQVNDTLFTHVEKADRTFLGAYQMLTNQFVKAFGAGIPFVNREDDMGDEGLRRAKEAYHPVALLKKYLVEIF